jgi:hypothetical protein
MAVPSFAASPDRINRNPLMEASICTKNINFPEEKS